MDAICNLLFCVYLNWIINKFEIELSNKEIVGVIKYNGGKRTIKREHKSRSKSHRRGRRRCGGAKIHLQLITLFCMYVFCYAFRHIHTFSRNQMQTFSSNWIKDKNEIGRGPPKPPSNNNIIAVSSNSSGPPRRETDELEIVLLVKDFNKEFKKYIYKKRLVKIASKMLL